MEQQDRLHALDAVRAFALLLGIVLHATMSFLPALTAAGWPFADNSPSQTLGVTFSIIHIFRMTLFFVMAGFFARLVLYRRGTKGFIKDRAKRILVPLAVAWPFVLGLIGLTFWWAFVASGKPMVAPPSPAGKVFLPFPWTHLWFLYVLLLLYVAVLSARWLADTVIDRSGRIRQNVDGFFARVMNVPIAPLFLAAPVALALYATPNWILWSGIPTPDNSLIPNLAATVGYGTAITVGWFLHRQVALLKTLQKFWQVYLAAAVVLAVACLSMAGSPGIASPPKLESQDRATYAALYSVAIWCWTFGLTGAALRFLSGESYVRRYLADSSYWLYILHLPLVFALQALVMQWPLHWSIKFTFVVGVTAGVLLLSYHYWVRSTYVGEVLNGRRYPRSAAQAAASVAHSVTPVDAHTESQPSILASLQQAQKVYGDVKALNGVDLEVRRGELLAVLGPNGAGKSTAIALLLGLQEPSGGGVQLFGQSPHSLDARRNVGIMMQEVTLAPELSVREHIDLVASYYPSPLTPTEAMQQIGIESLADRPYRVLSGGQKRQVQFAMAICGRPQLLFLDEPTVGLDLRAREAMWATIRALVQQGCSIVLTTHYLEEAEALADRVVVINKGQVIASGSIADMQALVSRRQISCITKFPRADLALWEGVQMVEENEGRISITTTNAEALLRRLLQADERLTELEVRRAGLSEAFSELTQEASR